MGKCKRQREEGPCCGNNNTPAGQEDESHECQNPECQNPEDEQEDEES